MYYYSLSCVKSTLCMKMLAYMPILLCESKIHCLNRLDKFIEAKVGHVLLHKCGVCCPDMFSMIPVSYCHF